MRVTGPDDETFDPEQLTFEFEAKDDDAAILRAKKIIEAMTGETPELDS